MYGGRVRRMALLAVTALAVAVPTSEAKRTDKLTVTAARASIAKIGKADVRRGDATSYAIRDCRRRSRTRVVCTLVEYGVLILPEYGGGIQDEMEFLALSRRGRRACLPESVGPDGCY